MQKKNVYKNQIWRKNKSNKKRWKVNHKNKSQSQFKTKKKKKKIQSHKVQPQQNLVSKIIRRNNYNLKNKNK